MHHPARAFLRAQLTLLLMALIAAPWPAHARRTPKDPWASTVTRVTGAVISIQLSVTRTLDTEGASSSQGTGFVVDKERGLVLTNRHMVHVGPVRARGIFGDNEEVELHAVYRDPVHDFGFYRFDPEQIRFMEIEELELAPERARVGVEIRVMGNDAGEKLSILDGTLARLDRPAPFYGHASYNDANTFYYQAATSTSGGSSGSPVVDITGAVVALNAGGSRSAASSFYLPVNRAKRVLDKLQRGEPVARGTLQAVYRLEPFEELRRLGLRPETEALVRAHQPTATGMLVIREVVPGGPSDGLILPGDILVTVGGLPAANFDLVEDQLDAAVGQTVPVLIERGGEQLGFDLNVDDLHALVPSSYLEFSQAILHTTSLQLARNHNVAAEGVVLVEPGYAFRRARIPSGAVIDAIDGEPIPDLDTLQGLLSSLPDGQRVRVSYRDLSTPRQSEVAMLTIDHRWAPMQRCERNDATGLWDCLELSGPEPGTVELPAEAPPTGTFEQVRDPVAAVLAPSLCHIRFTIPYRIEGVEGWTYVGAGMVVDAERGLVYTDRGTVPIALGDVVLTFAGSVRVPAEVVYLHPRHNVALLRYDPEALGDIPVRSAELLPGADLDAGDSIHQVGLTSSMRVVTQATTISRVDAISGYIPSPPAFRETNTEAYKLAEHASSIGGVLADDKGRVVGLWTFNVDGDGGNFIGLPVDYLSDLLDAQAQGEQMALRDLGIEVQPISLAAAADRGLPSEWVTRLADADPERRQALEVLRAHPDAPSFGALKGGDVLLAVGDTPVTRPRWLEEQVQASSGDVTLTLLHDGVVETLDIAPVVLDGLGVQRAVSFAGALFHEPHSPVAMSYGGSVGGLYVSWYWYGGPAAHFGLRASTLVRGVNGVPVENLDDFLAVVSSLADGDAVRLEVESLKHVRDVTTMLTDTVYWPTVLVERGPDGWHARKVDSSVANTSKPD